MLQQFLVVIFVVHIIMLFQAGEIKIRSATAFKNARECSPLCGSLVHLDMLFQIASGGEVSITEGAFEGFVTGMGSLMSNQVRDLAKRFRALRIFADEGPFLVVDTRMLLKRAQLGECLPA